MYNVLFKLFCELFCRKMVKQWLWIIILHLHVLTHYAGGEVFSNHLNSQIFCDHEITRNNSDLEVNTPAQKCNISNLLEFDIQDYSQFCLTWKTGTIHQYKLQYELRRLHSMLSPPFYIYLDFKTYITTDVKVHCQYNRSEIQKLRVRVQPMNCDNITDVQVLSLCPQSVLCTTTHTKLTEPTSITKQRKSHSDQSTEITIITVSLILGSCAFVTILIFRIRKYMKGKVGNFVPDTCMNNSTAATPNYIRHTCDRSTTSNNICNRNSITFNIERNSTANIDRLSSSSSEIDRNSTSNSLISTMYLVPGNDSANNFEMANTFPEHISKQLQDINMSFDSTHTYYEFGS